MNQVNRKVETLNHLIMLYKCVLKIYQTIPKSEKDKTQKLVFQLLEKTSIASPNYNKYLKYWISKIKIVNKRNG